MPMFYNCGDGMTPARMARHCLHTDVILCAPGPSLQPVARQPGLMVAALTKAYPVVTPDIWFGMDTPECYDRRVWAESFTKIARGGYQEVDLDGRHLSTYPNTYFASVREGLISDIFKNRTHQADFLWRRDTLMTALHVLIWMGAGAKGHPIYFNGFDLTHRGGKDYATGIEKVLTDELRHRNQMLFTKQIALLAEFARLAALNGITLLSTTPDSPLNQFMEFRPLDEALAVAKRNVPRHAPLLHSFETDIGKSMIAKQKKARVLSFSAAGARIALNRAKAKKQARDALKIDIDGDIVAVPRIDGAELSPTGALIAQAMAHSKKQAA